MIFLSFYIFNFSLLSRHDSLIKYDTYNTLNSSTNKNKSQK